jgi:hypothetical protein
MRLSTAICALLAAVPAISAGDEQFRCGGSIISVESSVAELLEKCGEPSSRQVSTEDVRAHVAKGGTQKLGTTTVETWRYDRSSRVASMIVTIADGKIQSIERGQ